MLISAYVCIVAEHASADGHGTMHKTRRFCIAGNIMALKAKLWCRLSQQMFEIAIVRIVAEQALVNGRVDIHKGCGCGVVSNDMALIAKVWRRFFQKVLVPACVCMVAGQALPECYGAMRKKCR